MEASFWLRRTRTERSVGLTFFCLLFLCQGKKSKWGMGQSPIGLLEANSCKLQRLCGVYFFGNSVFSVEKCLKIIAFLFPAHVMCVDFTLTFANWIFIDFFNL